MTHICYSNLTNIVSDNGLSSGRRQAIIWINAGMFLIGPFRNKLQWNLNHNSYIFIQGNAFENIIWKKVAFFSRPHCDNPLIGVITAHTFMWMWLIIHVLNLGLAPVPLSIFRSNSKFNENSKHSSVTYTWPITAIFCTRHDSATVVTCAKYRCDRSSIFETRAFWIFIEFDRNMLSGTGASPEFRTWIINHIHIKV